MTYLDTYTALCLYTGNIAVLSPRAKTALDADDDLFISPMVTLELQYLRERKRALRGAWRDVVVALGIEWGVHVRQYSFAVVATMAADKIRWTGDPFDRVIVAHAMANGGSPLVTRDREIRKHYPSAVW